MTLQEVVAEYLTILADDGVDDPLAANLMLASVLNDLFTISGEPVPSAIEQRLDSETVDWCGSEPPF